MPRAAVMDRRPQRAREGASGDAAEMWELLLFVAGTGLAVERVQDALERVCQEHLPGRHHIELVDVLQDPEQADAFDIVAAPTLVRQSPLPVRRIIGDLSQAAKVVLGLGIPVQEES